MNIFNDTLEMGLKALLILKAVDNQEISLERIVFYDSFTDEKKNHQESQLNRFLRRVSFQNGINLMLSRGLLNVAYTKRGILYQANVETIMLVKLLESNYSLKYQKEINKVVIKYADYAEEQIQQIKY